MIRYTLLFAILFMSSLVDAQPLRESTFEQNIEVAEEQYAKNDYYNARKFFEKAYEQQKDPRLARRIADLNFLLKDYKRAERWYSRVLKRDKIDQFVEARFDYGNALKMQGEYEQAWEQYNYYLEKGRDDGKKEIVKHELLGMQ